MIYTAPSIDDLKRLKNELGYTGKQMAELARLGGDHQWRKYTGGDSPREMGFHMLFFIAAQLTLSESEQKKIFDRMAEIGANI